MKEMVSDTIISGDLSVADVYALLYGDEVDWDDELAALEAEDDDVAEAARS
jgi:hypothetical protein